VAARESKGRTLLWRLILQFTGVMTDATGIGVGYRHCLARLNTGDYILIMLSNDASEYGVRFTKDF